MSAPSTSRRRSALLLALTLALAACGKKGSLRLPEDDEEGEP
ncbi:MAG: lipoprotein [Geminicoccaceae bacterium]|nr:lipoprotein [Geminicoccaceae bacterium]